MQPPEAIPYEGFVVAVGKKAKKNHRSRRYRLHSVDPFVMAVWFADGRSHQKTYIFAYFFINNADFIPSGSGMITITFPERSTRHD